MVGPVADVGEASGRTLGGQEFQVMALGAVVFGVDAPALRQRLGLALQHARIDARRRHPGQDLVVRHQVGTQVGGEGDDGAG